MSTTLHIRHSIGIFVGAVLISAAGCGGSSPTSPSSTATTGAGGGATISGIVSGSASTTGLTVRIVGTPLSAAVDSAGAFRVTAVPPGDQVRLQFVNNAVDATAAVPNVSASDVIQLRVQLTNTSAVVVSDERAGQVSLCHAEGNGTYHMISVAPDAEAAHRAHGDGKVGDPVPGRTGAVFGADCTVPVPPVETAKITLCHKTGNGSYHAITVALDAEPAHRAHGDAKIGEAVPGQPGKVFGATCQVQ